MANQPNNQPPPGVRVLPGVDLKLWLQFVLASAFALMTVAALALVWS